MKTMHYVIDNLDNVGSGKISCQKNDYDVDNTHRGVKLLKDLMALFPERERINASYNSTPFKIAGFGLGLYNHKFREYCDPNFSIKVYRKYEERKVNRADKNIVTHLELLISGEDEKLLGEKRLGVDTLLSKYNAQTGQSLRIEFKIYPASAGQQPSDSEY